MEELKDRESQLENLIQHGKKDEAVTLLFDLIVNHAKQKNFDKAESLRNKLIEVDSLALNEIIESAEVIEREKRQTIDPVHLQIWSEFHNGLTDVEKNCFFSSLRERHYKAKELIFRQGEVNSALYFVTSGKLALIGVKGDEKHPIRTLSAGDIAGRESFFYHTVCRASLIALTDVAIDYLERDIFDKWEQECPTLESRLYEYCFSKAKTHELLANKGINQRQHKRFTISCKAIAQILKADCGPVGKPFKVDLADISAGGLSFLVRIPKKEMARKLLDQRVSLRFQIIFDGEQRELNQTGKIVALRNHPYGDHSVHVKFDKVMPEREALELERACGTPRGFV